MREKIASYLRILPPVGLALVFGFLIAVSETGSVQAAIERMITAIVLWEIFALAWTTLRAAVLGIAWIVRTIKSSRRGTYLSAHAARSPRD